MKTIHVMGAVLTLVSVGPGFAGSREELMSRMGFSKQEIAKDESKHTELVKALDAVSPKNNSESGNAALGNAGEMNRPLTAQQIRDQAEALAQGAQEKADIAKAKQKEAEAKAEAAKARVLKMV